MLSWYPSTYALVVLDWLAWGNDQTEGILEYVLTVAIVVPAFIALVLYVGGGSDDSGSAPNDEL